MEDCKIAWNYRGGKGAREANQNKKDIFENVQRNTKNSVLNPAFKDTPLNLFQTFWQI